jgi:hypothetical protein
MDKASLKEHVDNLGESVGSKLKDAKQQMGRISGRITRFIQDHPAACLLGALTLGYLVARVARRQH